MPCVGSTVSNPLGPKVFAFGAGFQPVIVTESHWGKTFQFGNVRKWSSCKTKKTAFGRCGEGVRQSDHSQTPCLQPNSVAHGLALHSGCMILVWPRTLMMADECPARSIETPSPDIGPHCRVARCPPPQRQGQPELKGRLPLENAVNLWRWHSVLHCAAVPSLDGPPPPLSFLKRCPPPPPSALSCSVCSPDAQAYPSSMACVPLERRRSACKALRA